MVLVLFAFIAALVASIWWFLKGSKHPIDVLPGPFALPLVGSMLPFMKGRDAAWALFNEYGRRYAPAYKFWHGPVPAVTTIGPNYVEPVLSSNVHINKSFDYNFLMDWLGNGLLTSGGSKWHSRRKLLTPAFHFSILEQFVPVFSDKTRILIEKLRQHVDKPDGVDVVPLVTRCALDIICETAMGTTIHAQENSDSPYVSAVYAINELIIYRLTRPWLWPNWIFYLTPTGRKTAECLKILHSFTLKVIRERRGEFNKLKTLQKQTKEKGDGNIDAVNGTKKKIAFLDLLLQASEDNVALSDEDIREEVDTFMFEGHDTTAMAMSWTLFFLGTYPEVQAKCVEELSGIFSESGRDPTLTDLGNMKYLERVIKESLRIRPSVLLIARHLHQPIELEGNTFPAGTKMMVNIVNVQNNPMIFPDPEKFDPDRFLPENCVGRHPYAYIPFSAGPRNCIGQKFAMLEMKNLLSTVLRKFKLESIDPEHHFTAIPDLIIRPKYGVKLRLTPRKMP